MAERIAVRHQGARRDLSIPQGTMKLVGGNDTNDGLILEEHLGPPCEFPDTQFLTHMIAVGKVSVPCPMFWKEKGRERRGLVVPGGVTLSIATLQTGFRWEGNIHMSVLSIGIPMMERALPEPFAQRPVELIPVRAGERDAVLEHLIGALGAIFERYSSSERTAAESLSNATAVYLAQRYGVTPLKIDRYKVGLTQDRLSRVVDYIETYLESDLSLMELSGVACLSPYHFGKMFKRSTAQSVHQYVIARRLERAKLLLKSRAMRPSEIALAVGFQDQSQFTTLFKRHIGITPGAFSLITGGLKGNL
jgi:AraC family transcriptional regulator